MALGIDIRPSEFPSGSEIEIQIESSSSGECGVIIQGGEAVFENGTPVTSVLVGGFGGTKPDKIKGTLGQHIVRAEMNGETAETRINII